MSWPCLDLIGHLFCVCMTNSTSVASILLAAHSCPNFQRYMCVKRSGDININYVAFAEYDLTIDNCGKFYINVLQVTGMLRPEMVSSIMY